MHQSLTLLTELSIRAKKRYWDEPGTGFHFEIVGYEISGHGIDAAAEILAMAAEPAPFPVVKSEVARLRVSTKSGNETEDNLAMLAQVMIDECCEWPADVVRAACRGWARREKFFPSLAEMSEELRKCGRERKLLADAISAENRRRAPSFAALLEMFPAAGDEIPGDDYL